MKRPSFARGLVFALIAGLGALFWMLVAGPIFGYGLAAGLYGLGLVPCYTLAIAPNLRVGIAGFLLAGLLIAPALLLGPRLLLVFGITPFILGIVRSAILFPRPLARALYVEGVLGVLAWT